LPTPVLHDPINPRSYSSNALTSQSCLQVLLPRLLVLFAMLLPVTTVEAQSWPRLQTAEWTKTNFDKMSIEPDEIMSGGPPKDGIPAIDRPQFITLEAASEWLDENEPVIAFEHGGMARAYPLQILIFHEIVNDEVGGKPFAVTFCPLCNASIVFARDHNGVVLDFGTTGRLRKSDLVMYDRQTESWWQQFTGEGIVGDYTGDKLTQVPSQIVSFETFQEAFPEGEVLSKETGFQRQYGQNPYQGYDSIHNTPFLYQGKTDPRLRPMERVLSIPSGDGYHLVPLTELEDTSVLSMQLEGSDVVVFAPGVAASALDQSEIAASRDIPAAAAFSVVHGEQTLKFEVRDGNIVDSSTGSTWNALGHAVSGELAGERLQQIDSGVHFAFAWLAFDPDASIYGQ